MSKFCTNCGKRLDTNEVFCSNCGKRVAEDTNVSHKETIENKQETFIPIEENPYFEGDNGYGVNSNTVTNQGYENRGFEPDMLENKEFMPPYGQNLDIVDCSGKGLSIVGFVSSIIYFLQSFSVYGITGIPCFVVGLVFSILSVVEGRKCAIKAFPIISYILLGLGFIIQIISIVLYVRGGLHL